MTMHANAAVDVTLVNNPANMANQIFCLLCKGAGRLLRATSFFNIAEGICLWHIAQPNCKQPHQQTTKRIVKLKPLVVVVLRDFFAQLL